MATKKSTKTSKTAHVLNVLSHPPEEEYTGEGVPDSATSPGAPLPGPAQPRGHAQPLLPPILEDARSNEEAVSVQILEALSQELVTEALTAEPAKEPVQEEPIPEESAPVEPVPVAPAPAAAAPVESVPVAPAPVAAAPTPVPPVESPLKEAPAQAAASEARAPTPPRLHEQLGHISMAELADDLVYVNVMQALVEEKAPKYIKMFGLCTCSRCVADVKAQALTCLPPKYAVMRSGECIPMLTVYEGRYSSALVAQILAACKLVMDHPRH